MPRSVSNSRARVVGFTAVWVMTWVVVLLTLGLVELLVDPNFENSAGALLDAASIAVAAMGLLAVPIGTAARCRAGGQDWRFSAALGGFALVAYIFGLAVDIATYRALEGL